MQATTNLALFDPDTDEDEEWWQSEPPEGLRHRGLKRAQCKGCGRIVTLSTLLCEDCAEAGPSNYRTPELSAIALPPNDPSLGLQPLAEESKPKSTSFAAATLFLTFIGSLAQIRYHVRRLRPLFPHVYLAIFLYIPTYYSTSASSILELAAVCEPNYEDPVPFINDEADTSPQTPYKHIAIITTSLRQPQNGEILPDEMIPTRPNPSPAIHTRALHHPTRQPTVLSPTETLDGNSYPPSPSQPTNPASLTQLREAWKTYVEIRLREWKYLFTFSTLIVGFAIAVFQIPDTSQDLVIRVFASLSLFRALVGAIHAPILCALFLDPRNHILTENFAISWTRETRRRDGRTDWKPWIILSLPAIATFWSLIFFFIAMFAFVWRTGASSPSSPPTLPFGLSTLLRSVMAGWALLDIGLAVWICRTITRIGGEASRAQDQ